MNQLTDEFITYKLIKPVPEPGNTVSIERGNGDDVHFREDVYKRQAFRYYLPAVIYISFEELIKLQKLKDSDLLVDCTCQNLSLIHI